MQQQHEFPLMAEYDLEVQELSRDAAVCRTMTAKRCRKMELALRAIGFVPGTIYWDVAMLIARVSQNWLPLIRSLDDLVNDNALKSIKSNDAANRKRSFRRALRELAKEGLITYKTEAGEGRRRTRPHVLYTITLDRLSILTAADGDPGPRPNPDTVGCGHFDTDADNTPDSSPDDTPDNSPDTEKSLFTYTLSTPNPLSPTPKQQAPESSWNAVAARLRRCGVVRWAPLVNELRKCVYTSADLCLRIIDHYESQPGAWGPVALVDRLRHSHVDTPATELWWTANEAWTRAEALRAKIRAEANSHQKPIPEELILQVIARDLQKYDLSHCMTQNEKQALTSSTVAV